MTRLFGRQIFLNSEVFDLSRNVHTQLRVVKFVDQPNARLPSKQTGPSVLHRVADRRNQPKASDNDPTAMM